MNRVQSPIPTCGDLLNVSALPLLQGLLLQLLLLLLLRTLPALWCACWAPLRWMSQRRLQPASTPHEKTQQRKLGARTVAPQLERLPRQEEHQHQRHCAVVCAKVESYLPP